MEEAAEGPSRADRGGRATRERIRAAALELFTAQGFEGTSIKDLADALGMTKSALYHHYASKDAIVLDLFAARQGDVDALLVWVESQPPGPRLLRATALRWAEGLSVDVLRGMRFARANLPAMRRLGGARSTGPYGFDRIIDALVPGGTAADLLRARTVFEVGVSAILAAEGLDISEQDVLDTARDAIDRLTR